MLTSEAAVNDFYEEDEDPAVIRAVFDREPDGITGLPTNWISQRGVTLGCASLVGVPTFGGRPMQPAGSTF